MPANIGPDIDRDGAGPQHRPEDLAQLRFVGAEECDMPSDRNRGACEESKAVAQQANLAQFRAGARRCEPADDPFPARRLADMAAYPREELDPGCDGASPF